MLFTLMMLNAQLVGAADSSQQQRRQGSDGSGDDRADGGSRAAATSTALVPYRGPANMPVTSLPQQVPSWLFLGNVPSLLPVDVVDEADNRGALMLYEEPDQLWRELQQSPLATSPADTRSELARDGSPAAAMALAGRAFADHEALAQQLSQSSDLSIEYLRDVLSRYLVAGEQLGYEIGSAEEVSNYIRGLYGMPGEGAAVRPRLTTTDPAALQAAIDTRLAAPEWQGLSLQKWVAKYAGREAEILQAITDIEIHLNRRGLLRKERQIAHPESWIDDYLSGRPFESAPDLDADGRLVWSRGPSPSRPYDSKHELVASSEIDTIFELLASQIPHADARDGCFARGDFSAYYLQVLRGLGGVGKIRVQVSGKDPRLRPQAELFKEAAHGKAWFMHTAATLTTADGRTYVMDVALKKPLLEDQWISALAVESGDDLAVKKTGHWRDDLQEDKKDSVSLDSVLAQMRGLYLSEKLGADPQTGRFLPWDSWQYTMPAFAPVEAAGAKTYRLEAQSARHLERGFLSGKELTKGSSVADGDGEYYRLDFPQQSLTLYVPKGVGAKGIKSTGISGLPVSKADINQKLKDVAGTTG